MPRSARLDAPDEMQMEDGDATGQEMLRVCIHNMEGHEAGEKSELLKNAVIALVPSQPEIAHVSSVSSFLGKNGVIS